MSLGKLTINLDLESVKFEKGLSKSEQQVQRFSRNFQLDMDKAVNSAKQFSQRTTEYLNNIEVAAKNINRNTSLNFWSQIGGGLKAFGSDVVRFADSHTELANKIKLVTETQFQHAQAMASVYDISMKTAQSTQAVSAVYQSFAQNAKELGINQRQVASVTETISKAVAISGASTAEAKNALTQFSQTLLMGKMRAQEYNSMMTQTPAVLQAIARGLGVTMGQLKEMSDKGELTTDKMIQGLEKSKKSVDELYGKTATTISGAMQNLSTATEKFIGEIDKATGVSNLAATGINTLAQNLNALIPILLYSGTAFVGMKLPTVAAQTWQVVNAKIQDVRVTTEQAQKILFKTTARQREVAEELNATRAYIASLHAQMNLAHTEQQRIMLSNELSVQLARETSLVAANTAATKALAAAQQQANVAKRAGLWLLNALGGPWGVAMGAISVGAMYLYNWHQEAEQARQKAFEFANELPRIKENIESMNSIDLRATKAQLEESAEVQQRQVDQLKRKVQELKQEIENTPKVKVLEADGYEFEIDQTQKIIRMQRELDKTVKELNDSEIKLNDTKQTIATTMDQMPVTELRDRLAELFPNIEQSQIKVDGLNVSLGSFISNVPIASVEALKFAGAVGQIATSAINAAIAVANLAGAQVGNEKLNLHLALLNSSPSKGGKTGGSSKKDKLAEKAKRESEKNHENYLNQVAEMSQRLAGLKAEAQEIALFGQPSQYQEVRKLTEDMVINADKYKTIGLEGIEKLKSLAAKLDSESQNIAIQKLKFESNEALDAMQFGLTLLGKTRTEQELIQFNHQLDLEANRLKQEMTAENIAKLDEEIAKLKERRAEIQAQAEAMRSDWKIGMKDGWNSIQDDVSNVAENTKNITVNAFSQMSNALMDFTTTGKMDFRSMAQSILRDINAMIIKMLVFKAIQTGASFLFGYQGATTTVSGNAVYGMGTWATGGYTGDGGKYTPAGIVHRGEYVITKEATSRLGLDYLNYLNYGKRGFATGGGVGVPRVPSTPTHFGGSQNVTVTVINNGKPTSAEVETKKDGQDLAITVKLMEQIADGVYRRNQTRDLRSGGALNR